MSLRTLLWARARSEPCHADLSFWLGLSLAFFLILFVTSQFCIAPAVAQEQPKGIDKLIDSKKTGTKQEKTPDGLPKFGLKDPACNSEECNKLWSKLREALESWYVLQLSSKNDDQTIKSAREALGNPNTKDLSAIRDRHTKRTREKDSPYGDKDKLTKSIKDLLTAYEKCLKPCPEPPPPPPPPPPPVDEHSPGFSDLPEGPQTPKEFDQYETWCKGIKLPPCGDKQKAKKEAEKLLDDIKEALHRLNEVAVKSPAAEKKSQPAAEACSDAKKKVEKFLKEDLKDCPEEKKKTETGGGGGSKESDEEEQQQETEQEVGRPSDTNVSRVLTGTDSEKWCTYTDGVAFEMTLIQTDETGVPVEITEVTTTKETTTTEQPPPTTPETPTTTEQPPSTTPETPTTTEQPPPTTPETPATTEKPPEEPASPIPDTIFVKAKESVLEGQPTGNPIENQVVKLFPPEEPQLPSEGGSKEARDAGFDKDPVECTTGADGNCRMHVSTEDRALYGMPSTGAKPGKTYRIDYDLPQTSGGVAETTGRPAEPDVTTGTPGGAKVTREIFKIGERTFVRLVYEQPHGLDHNFEEQFKPIFSESYEEDDCRDKQPGPPLGMEPHSYGSLNRELPETTIKLKTRAVGALP